VQLGHLHSYRLVTVLRLRSDTKIIGRLDLRAVSGRNPLAEPDSGRRKHSWAIHLYNNPRPN